MSSMVSASSSTRISTLASETTALLHQVEQAARSRDDDLGLARELALLATLAHAAVDHGVAKLEVAAVSLRALADLGRQLAGGREHQRSHGAVAVGAREPLEEREHEGSGLARARLSGAEQVLTCCDGRDGLELDGGRCGVAFVGHRSQKGSGEAEIGEGGGIRCERLCLHDGRSANSGAPGFENIHFFPTQSRGSSVVGPTGTLACRKECRGTTEDMKISLRRDHSNATKPVASRLDATSTIQC